MTARLHSLRGNRRSPEMAGDFAVAYDYYGLLGVQHGRPIHTPAARLLGSGLALYVEGARNCTTLCSAA